MLSFPFFVEKCCDANFFKDSLGKLKYFHSLEKMEIAGTQKLAKKFYCEKCDYGCSKESDFKKHLGTRKHLNGNNPAVAELAPVAIDFKCNKCKKKYETKSGLWKHNKLCTYEPQPAKKHKLYEKDNLVEILLQEHTFLKKENNDFKTMILDLVKTNSELQKQMLEVCKNGTGGSHNQNHTNSHNKTFNMNVFLNEQCKDAMNIMDFVNTMTLEFADLEEVGKVGYVEGISNIIIKKLNDMDIYKRPIHCSDAKREIMYVKDENVWEKENNTYDKLRKAIKHVTCKNSSMLEPWSKAHPQCMNTSHRLNDVYVQMIGQSMGGKESFLESENKIMKKIAKAVLIDKNL